MAFVSEPVALLGPRKLQLDLYKSLALAAFRDYLWVLVPLPLLVAFTPLSPGAPGSTPCSGTW